MNPAADITVIILAGGKSSRMGEDKGLVVFNGKRLAEHVINTARSVTNKIFIVTGNPGYTQFGCLCVADALTEKGPLGGIYTGLIHSATQKNLLLACDMPFLTEKLLLKLVNSCSDEDVLLTEHNNLAEPLCSVYDKTCVAHIRSLLEKNQLKITDALAGLETRVISFDREDWFSGKEFANINSIEELNKYKS